MKTPSSILIIALLTVLSITAYAGDPVWMQQANANVNLKTTPSVLLLPAPRQSNSPDPCREYKRKEIAGFVLLPVGVGMVTGGGIMLYRGVNDIINRNSNLNLSEQQYSVSHHDVAFVAAGSVLTLVGLILTPTGLVMGTRGAVRYHKYCGGDSRAYFGPSSTGLGVAYNF